MTVSKVALAGAIDEVMEVVVRVKKVITKEDEGSTQAGVFGICWG